MLEFLVLFRRLVGRVAQAKIFIGMALFGGLTRSTKVKPIASTSFQKTDKIDPGWLMQNLWEAPVSASLRAV